MRMLIPRETIQEYGVDENEHIAKKSKKIYCGLKNVQGSDFTKEYAIGAKEYEAVVHWKVWRG